MVSLQVSLLSVDLKSEERKQSKVHSIRTTKTYEQSIRREFIL